jgi:hypothetical protein
MARACLRRCTVPVLRPANLAVFSTPGPGELTPSRLNLLGIGIGAAEALANLTCLGSEVAVASDPPWRALGRS